MEKSPYVPEPVKIKKRVQHSGDNFSIFVDWPIKYEPGQFAQVSVLGIGEAPISFASYGQKEVEFNIRVVGSVTKALSKLKVGQKIWVRGPYGKGYPMETMEGNDLIFVGGGCGVAPLKGAIEYIEQNKNKYGKIHLFLGFRTPEDILFQEEMERWQKNFNVHLTVDKTMPESCYVGDVGFVTEAVKKEKLDNKNKIVFVCGPPIMMNKVIEIFEGLKFNENQIYMSVERLMHCAFGKCGACMVRGKYTCMDGPVFRVDELKGCETD